MEFVDQVIVELYDEEVAKHPEGISAADVAVATLPKISAVLPAIRADRGGDR